MDGWKTAKTALQIHDVTNTAIRSVTIIVANLMPFYSMAGQYGSSFLCLLAAIALVEWYEIRNHGPAFDIEDLKK